MRRTLAILCAVAAGVVSAGSSPPPAQSGIAIQSRFASPYCAGLCLDYDLSVHPDGRLYYRVRSAVDGAWRAVAWRASAWQLSQERYEAFRARLAAIRPTRAAGPLARCGPDMLPGVVPLTIEWHDMRPAARLESCATGPDAQALREALRALRFGIALGRPLTAEEAADRNFI